LPAVTSPDPALADTPGLIRYTVCPSSARLRSTECPA
jgi:hypothetical protein